MGSPARRGQTAPTCRTSPPVSATKCKVIQSSVYLKNPSDRFIRAKEARGAAPHRIPLNNV